MSDRVVHSDRDSDGLDRQSAQLYPQSVWMTHWMHSTCKPEVKEQDPLLNQYCGKESGEGVAESKPEVPADALGSSTGVKEFFNRRTDSVKSSSATLGKEGQGSQSFPMFVPLEDRNRVSSAKDLRYFPEGVSGMGAPIREFRPEDILGNLELKLNSHESFGKVNSGVSRPDVASSSKNQPVRYNKGKEPINPLVGEKQEVCTSTSPDNVSKDDFLNSRSLSDYANLVQVVKFSNPLEHGRYGALSSNPISTSLALHTPAVSDTQQPGFTAEQSKKMQNSSIRLFPGWNTPMDASKEQSLFSNFFSAPGLKPLNQGLKMVRSRPNEISPVPPKFSQTAHHFEIAKKSDVNLSQGEKRFKDSTDGEMFHGFPTLSSGLQGCQSVKLEQPLSSTNNEGVENIRDANTKTSTIFPKYESSADTDAMDMDVPQKKPLSGVLSPPKDKIVNGALVATPLQAAVVSTTEENGGRVQNPQLPDINEALVAPPAVRGLVDGMETSSSRTQSLEAEHIFSHAELPTNTKNCAVLDVMDGSDPSIRWVKRLKPNAAGSSYATKWSDMEEASSHEKVNRFLSNMRRCSVTNSEHTASKRSGKEPMALDGNVRLLSNRESPSSDSVEKSQEISLSHPWIKRWCHESTASPPKNDKAVVICEPEKSISRMDELHKKQYPSIAAMAMIGKALNSVQTCHFRRTGPYIVWND